jgi:hypothetical protein
MVRRQGEEVRAWKQERDWRDQERDRKIRNLQARVVILFQGFVV